MMEEDMKGGDGSARDDNEIKKHKFLINNRAKSPKPTT
jgi:hypothetical protein